jgi:hypothetical protein
VVSQPLRAGILRPALLSCAILLCGLPGCAHEHVIGLGPTGLGETSARQLYLLFGLVTVNEVNVQRMASDLTSYSVHTEYSIVDILLAPLLLPLTMTSRTVTVKT